MKLLREPDHRLCHLLPRHAAVRADPAGAFRADAGAAPSRDQPAAVGRGRPHLPPGTRRLLLRLRGAGPECRAHLGDLPRRHPGIHLGQTQATLLAKASPTRRAWLRDPAADLPAHGAGAGQRGRHADQDSSLVSAIGTAGWRWPRRAVAGAYSRYHWEPYLAISAILSPDPGADDAGAATGGPAHLRGR